MNSTPMRVALAAASCALTAYRLIVMDDASVPPRDEDWSEYFLGFVLLGPALVGALLAIRRPIHTLRSNAVTSVGAPR